MSINGLTTSATDSPVVAAVPAAPLDAVSTDDDRDGVAAAGLVDVRAVVSWGAWARVVSVLIDTMLSNSRGVV
jgi:hypothetical protein